MAALNLITITAENMHWAVNENFVRIYSALGYKVPLTGKVQLLGNLDFASTYTVRNFSEDGPTSATKNP